MHAKTENQSRRVMIVAGESSGDLHGSNLLRAAADSYPQLEFFGVGGDRMRDAGCQIVFPSDQLSVMGLVEVFFQLPRLIARFRQLKRILQGAERPDLLVLIDFPDFNLRLAKVAKQLGIPVLYYISPKVWAWRSGRTQRLLPSGLIVWRLSFHLSRKFISNLGFRPSTLAILCWMSFETIGRMGHYAINCRSMNRTRLSEYFPAAVTAN